MPKGINGWGYRHIIKFLRSNDFVFAGQRKGSHEAWISLDEKAVVEVNRLDGGKTYPQLTMKTMIGQSGIDESVWRDWAGGKTKKKKVNR